VQLCDTAAIQQSPTLRYDGALNSYSDEWEGCSRLSTSRPSDFGRGHAELNSGVDFVFSIKFAQPKH